jgi:hypothetical protein
MVVIDDENSRSVSERAAPATNRTGGTAGDDPVEVQCGYGAMYDDTSMTMTTPSGPDHPSVTIDSLGGGRNRLGAECCYASLNRLLGGMKSENGSTSDAPGMFQFER